MNRFRLLHWVELPEEFHQLKFRRAMAAMSARPVDRQQLASECGIDRKEMRVFIDALLLAGAISVHPPLRADYMRRMSRRHGDATGADAVSRVLSWLRHSWNADAPLNQGASHG